MIIPKFIYDELIQNAKDKGFEKGYNFAIEEVINYLKERTQEGMNGFKYVEFNLFQMEKLRGKKYREK